MKYTLSMAAAFSLLLCLSTSAEENYQTGLSDLKVADERKDRPLDGFVWYPTNEQDGVTIHHENPVWQGINAIKDAELVQGKRPLVVLSHGMFGNAMNQSWLASKLSTQGYLVAAINHPGTSTWMRDANQRRQLWERPRDISRVIDYLTQSSSFADQIDQSRIYMAGHSLGGFTAVALAGGRYDAARLDETCKMLDDDLVCGIFDRWDIAKTDADRMEMERDLSDSRIKEFAVFDLGGTQSFSSDSLASMKRPMLVYGAPISSSGINLDVESRALVKILPEANTTYIEPADLAHFDFLGVCKDGSIELLKEEEPGDEIICVNGGKVRADKHEQIAKRLVAFFEEK